MYLYRVDLLLVLPVMENQPFTCGICLKQFSSRPNMLQHQRTHTQATHKCPPCQAKFSRSDLLQNHVKTHGKKGRFEHDPMVDHPILHVFDGSDGSTIPIDLITLRSERTASTTTSSNTDITASVNSVESCHQSCKPQSTPLSYVTPHPCNWCGWVKEFLTDKKELSTRLVWNQVGKVKDPSYGYSF